MVRMACRKKYYDEREATYDTMEKMRRRQAAGAAEKARVLREGKGNGR